MECKQNGSAFTRRSTRILEPESFPCLCPKQEIQAGNLMTNASHISHSGEKFLLDSICAERSVCLKNRSHKRTWKSIAMRLASLGLLPATSLLATTFNYTGDLQSWTVPETATYDVVAVGAAGGFAPFNFETNSGPGQGAQVEAALALTQGQVLNILVGGVGHDATESLAEYGAGGGGGGTFVYDANPAVSFPYLVAGGGGGGGAQSNHNGTNASQFATAGVNGGGAPGASAGLGGQGGSENGGGGGGAGYSFSGVDGSGTYYGTGGGNFSGGSAGEHAGAGGFGGGGGGGGHENGGGGGGGGYIGGGGGLNGYGGGAGGSFSSVDGATFSTNPNIENGSVTITELTSVTPAPEPCSLLLVALVGALLLPRFVGRRSSRSTWFKS
jgi:hypothetical protein